MDITKISIDNEKFKKYKKAYEYALNKTKEEIDQSIEGLYHNLNSLNLGRVIK